MISLPHISTPIFRGTTPMDAELLEGYEEFPRIWEDTVDNVNVYPSSSQAKLQDHKTTE